MENKNFNWQPMGDKERAFVLKIQLSNYIGQQCPVCHHIYSSIEDLDAHHVVRFNHPPESVQLACKECFMKVYPDYKDDA